MVVGVGNRVGFLAGPLRFTFRVDDTPGHTLSFVSCPRSFEDGAEARWTVVEKSEESAELR